MSPRPARVHSGTLPKKQRRMRWKRKKKKKKKRKRKKRESNDQGVVWGVRLFLPSPGDKEGNQLLQLHGRHHASQVSTFVPSFLLKKFFFRGMGGRWCLGQNPGPHTKQTLCSVCSPTSSYLQPPLWLPLHRSLPIQMKTNKAQTGAVPYPNLPF